ncbi:MAG: type IV pilus modification protein PilV [Methylococcales bacterium]
MTFFHFKKQSKRYSSLEQNRGSTLIEVLVTAVIMAVGLLGVASVQITSLKTNDSTYNRTQSAMSTYNMMDYIRANRESAIAGDYNISLSAFSDLSTPSGNSIPETDRYHWFQKLNNNVPSAKAAINCNSSGICAVKVQWDDTRAEATTSTKHIVLNAQL